jgi:hypothetical protein
VLRHREPEAVKTPKGIALAGEKGAIPDGTLLNPEVM